MVSRPTRIDEPGIFGPTYRDGLAWLRLGEPRPVGDLQQNTVSGVERDLHVEHRAEIGGMFHSRIEAIWQAIDLPADRNALGSKGQRRGPGR